MKIELNDIVCFIWKSLGNKSNNMNDPEEADTAGLSDDKHVCIGNEMLVLTHEVSGVISLHSSFHRKYQ